MFFELSFKARDGEQCTLPKSKLSGGQKQRVRDLRLVALAIQISPATILLLLMKAQRVLWISADKPLNLFFSAVEVTN